MRLWLIRHGETQANVDGLYSGHAPTPLTARGIEQAQNLHTLLHDVSFDLVLCSELERAQHTARLVLSDRQHPVHIIPELNEMFFGDWEMRHHRDLMQEDAENYSAWCNDWQHAIPTNGEGFQAFSQRVERFIARLSEYQHYQNILVVSHQGVLSLLITRLIGMPAESMWHFRLPSLCGISALTRGVGAPLISTKNSRRYASSIAVPSASSIAVPSGSRMHDFSVFLRVSRNDH